MSRIAGVLSPNPRAAAPDAVRKILAAVAPIEGTRPMTATRGDATLGCLGIDMGGIASSGSVTAVLDGSIYNAADLREDDSLDQPQLVAQLFRSQEPTGAASSLNGDFAIAAYDESTRSLTLVRDRLGIRPLYYVWDGRRLAFSSRIIGLLSVPGVRKTLRREFVARYAACHYRTFDNEIDRSPFEDVQQLPAGHLLHVRDGALTIEQWWSLADAAELEGDEQALAEQYQGLLLDSVDRRLALHPEAGFTLSGGLDSSTVLACAQARTGRRQQALSTVYDDPTYDETAEIASMLDQTTEAWHPIRIGSPDIVNIVRRMVPAHDEPVVTATWLSHFILCEAAAQLGMSSIFGGLGGDEINAGEYEYFIFHFADLRVRNELGPLAREIEEWTRHHDHPIYRKGPSTVEAGFGTLVDLATPGRCLPDRDRLFRWAAAIDPSFFDLRSFEPEMEQPFTSYLKNRTWQDLTRETTPPCLRAEDRNTAAFGLRNVDPLLDHRLVEFMFRISGTHKIRDGITKRLLREATRGILPEETRTRVAKTGWNAPAHRWFSGDGRDSLLEIIESSTFRARGIYDIDEVRRVVDEHDEIVRSGRPVDNHMMFLWQLVNLEVWLQWVEDR